MWWLSSGIIYIETHDISISCLACINLSDLDTYIWAYIRYISVPRLQIIPIIFSDATSIDFIRSRLYSPISEDKIGILWLFFLFLYKLVIFWIHFSILFLAKLMWPYSVFWLLDEIVSLRVAIFATIWLLPTSSCGAS